MRRLLRPRLHVLPLLALSALGCGVSKPASTGDSGAVGLTLQVTPGLTLNTAAYAISGPGGFSRSGSVDETHSSMLSALISALPAGGGFTILVTATASDGATQ